MAAVDEDGRRFLRRLSEERWHFTFLSADEARRLEQLGLVELRPADPDAVEVRLTPRGTRAVGRR